MPSVLINSSTDGDVLVAAQPGYLIRVLGFDVSAATAVQFGLDSKAAGGTRTNIYLTNATLGTGFGIVRPPFDDWQLDCNPGESLVIKLGGAVNVAGALTYALKMAPGTDTAFA